MPNVHRYSSRGRTWWRVDVWLKTPTGRVRLREGNIPTREQALARLAKATADAYQGLAFDIRKASTLTVKDAWELYQPISERDNKAWRADASRAKHLVRHLAGRICATLTQEDVDAYRTLRQGEKALRGGKARQPPPKKKGQKPPAPPPAPKPPSAGTLNRELETLKRIINYAVSCGRLQFNPIARVPKLEEAAPRKTVLEDDAFDRLLELARASKRSAHLEPILLVGFDTGMRKTEVLQLRRDQVDWKTGVIRLWWDETKTKAPRIVVLQARTLAALKLVPVILVKNKDGRLEPSAFVFANPRTGQARGDFKTAWAALRKRAGLGDVWVHDLRHSFCTLARRRGLAESVVMQSSGHKTRAVFDRYNLVDESDARLVAQTMQAARDVAQQPATAQQFGQHPAKEGPPREGPSGKS